MMVPEPDSTPDLAPDQKNYEILKFDELQVFSVFNDMNGISDNFGWFSGENGKFGDFNTFCEMSELWMRILNDVNCHLKLHG